MGRPPGSIALKSGDQWSSDFPGYIELANGQLRRPRKWTDPQGRVRCTNTYFDRKFCAACGTDVLQATKHVNLGWRPYCSKQCKSKTIKGESQGNRIIKKLGIQQGHYVLIKSHGHPRATNNGTVREHILVVERQIGRFLNNEECIHHIDFIKHNNDPSNLFLCKNNDEHLAIHRSLNTCVEILLAGGQLYFDHVKRRYAVHRG